MVAVTQTGQKEILLLGAAASSATIGALSAGERNKKYYKMQIRIQLNGYINSNTNKNRKYYFFSVLIFLKPNNPESPTLLW